MKLRSDECQWTLLIEVNIGSGNGLVPSGNKLLPGPMLTDLCRHMASLGHNELSHRVDTIHSQGCWIEWILSSTDRV